MQVFTPPRCWAVHPASVAWVWSAAMTALVSPVRMRTAWAATQDSAAGSASWWKHQAAFQRYADPILAWQRIAGQHLDHGLGGDLKPPQQLLLGGQALGQPVHLGPQRLHPDAGRRLPRLQSLQQRPHRRLRAP